MTDTTPATSGSSGAPGLGAFPVGFAGFLSGFGSNIFIQPNPASGALTPLSVTALGSKDLVSVALADPLVIAIAVPANNLFPQSVGAFGPGASSSISLPLQGVRYSNNINTQSTAPSPKLTISYDVSNIPLTLLSSDGHVGTTTRTAVITSTLAAGAVTYTWYYSFNFRASPVSFSVGPDQAHLAEVTLVPTGGNQFGYAYTTSP